MQDVTILSWNVAALRALGKNKNAAGRSNWLRRKLGELGEPTCVCLQETKIPRDMLTEDVAILEDYNAFFSHAHRGVAQGGAYSGVVTYVRKELRVEAAVAGLVCCSYMSKKGVNDLPSTAEEKACTFACAAFREAWEVAVCALDDHELEEQQSKSNEESEDGRAGGEGSGGGEGMDEDTRKEMMGKHDDDDDDNEEVGLTYEELVKATNPEDLLRMMDKEGRVVMTDHAAFVLINVYAPFNGQPGRARFKRAFNAALTARVQTLSEVGRQIVLCGDLNAMPQAIDSVEPPSKDELRSSPWVRWMRELLAPRAMAVEGRMEGKDPEDEERLWAGLPLLVDTFRALHPKQPNAFTCWCNQTQARLTNYGRRIDYVLASPGLCGHGGSAAVAQLTEAEVQQEIVGSDHCPVMARFAFAAAATCLPLAADEDHGAVATPAFSAASPFLAPGEEQKALPPLCTCTFSEFRAKQTAMHAFLGSSAAKGAAQGMASSTSSTTSASSRAAAPHAFSASASSRLWASYGEGGEAETRDMRHKVGGKKRGGAPAARRAPKLQLTLAHYGISKQAKATASQGSGSTTKAAAAAVSVDVVGGMVGAGAATMVASSSSSSSSVAVAGMGAAPLLNPADEASKREVFLNAFRPKKEEVPRCSHGELMVRRQVKKAESENCGRYFFCCTRPEGAEGDKEARCKTFVWEDTLAMGAGGKRVRGLLQKG